MTVKFVFGKISNAGMSFTDKINENLIKMYNYTCDCDDVVEYKDFQKRLNDNCDISESNVRMYFPFLFCQGFINDYKNGALIKISDFFTPLGKAFVKSLLLSCKLNDEALKSKACDITKDILALSMFNRKRMKQKDYYFDFLELCFRYDKIGVNEFNYMLYEKEIGKKEDYVVAVSEKIHQFRNGAINFEFLQDRKNKQGEQVRDTLPDNTFNYTRNLLLEAGLIVETDNKEYRLNPDRRTVAQLLIKEDM